MNSEKEKKIHILWIANERLKMIKLFREFQTAVDSE